MWLITPTNRYAFHDNVHNFFVQNPCAGYLPHPP